MKMPVWYKDRNGKWQVFPPEIGRYLRTFEDGRQGVGCSDMREAGYFANCVPTEDFWEIFDRYDPKYIRYHDPRYVLKESQA